jgi:hypothetical protein
VTDELPAGCPIYVRRAPPSSSNRPTLKPYLAAEHLDVTTLPSVQNIPDKQLAALGAKGAALGYHGTRPHTDQWHEADGGKQLHLAARESETGVASISFLDGLVPEAGFRRSAHLASRGYAPSFSSGIKLLRCFAAVDEVGSSRNEGGFV